MIVAAEVAVVVVMASKYDDFSSSIVETVLIAMAKTGARKLVVSVAVVMVMATASQKGWKQ